MLRRDSPLYIRPSLEPAFLAFLWRMARHCNTADYRAGMEALIRLSEGTMARLDAYRADGIEFEMHADGLLMAFLDRARWTAHQEHLDIAEGFGLEPVPVETPEGRREYVKRQKALGEEAAPLRRRLLAGLVALQQTLQSP